MKVEKKVIAELEKAYAIAPLTGKSGLKFLVAAEKHSPCFLFDEEGNKLDTIWEEPGGVMTITQVPDKEDQFLATHKMYSPNDGMDAKIVIATKINDKWDIRTLVDIPYAHRFGILTRDGINYLIVFTLKSGHDFKDDWSHPGMTWAAVLPDDLSAFNDENQLKLNCIKTDMCRNHGYSKYITQDGTETAIASSDEGVFQFIPPSADSDWEIKQLYDQPVSDAVLIDLDNDGKPELGCISPFHGDTLYVCHLDETGRYVKQWEHPEKMEFLHATWPCEIDGRNVWIVGYRKGNRDFFLLYNNNGYKIEYIDRDNGSTNAFFFKDSKDRNVIVSANREINEVALYYVNLR